MCRRYTRGGVWGVWELWWFRGGRKEDGKMGCEWEVEDIEGGLCGECDTRGGFEGGENGTNRCPDRRRK